MKYCFILNPAAGKGRAVQAFRQAIEQTCREREVCFEIYLTAGVGDAREYVKRTLALSQNEAFRFYACGGDGTLCEVVNGLMASPGHERHALGILPSGTGNDFVRNFTNNEHFSDIGAQLSATEQEIDLLRCNDTYAINMINIGFDCEVVAQTAKLKKKAWIPQKCAYLAGLVSTFVKKPDLQATIGINGQEPQACRYLLTAYANGAFCGGGFHSNPKSSLNDGKIDALFVNPVSRLQFVSMVGAYQKGTHLAKKYEKILHNEKVDRIDLWFDRATNVSIDGEIVSVRDLHITPVARALRILIPDGSMMIGEWDPETASHIASVDKEQA